ncbi:Hypothetical protein PBC10988_27430 [Planctomycetales bacterium 10988]|nr:Hypothetical protein PBC10988_27430 [Planctomycetales bacterium 10988]
MTYLYRLLCVGVFVVTLFLNNRASANNNFFLPGDAYFPTVLTEETIRQLSISQMIKYQPMGYDFAFCGYAGYSKCHIAGLDEILIENLRQAYKLLNEGERQLYTRDPDSQEIISLDNLFPMLIYPDDFDATKFKLALRYNETWMAETEKFGHKNGGRLCCLIDDKDAVMESWRDAARVPPLEATLPKTDPELGKLINEPIRITGPVQFIIVHRSLENYFRPSMKNLSFIIVNTKEIIKYTYKEEKWIVTQKIK